MRALAPKKPLIAIVRLMHPRIAPFLPVPCRTGRVDDGRIDDGAGRDADAASGLIQIHRIKHLAA